MPSRIRSPSIRVPCTSIPLLIREDTRCVGFNEDRDMMIKNYISEKVFLDGHGLFQNQRERHQECFTELCRSSAGNGYGIDLTENRQVTSLKEFSSVTIFVKI